MFPSLTELQGQRIHKANCLKEIITNAENAARVLTAEESSTFDRIKAELDGLDAQIQTVQDTLNRRQQLDDLVKGYEQSAGRKSQPDQPAKPDNATPTVPAMPLRYSSLKAFKGTQAGENAYKCGKWLRAVLLNDWRAQQECLNRGWFQGEVRNALGTNSNPAGGFLVPDEFSQAIIDLREAYGVFRREVRVQPMGRDSMYIPRRASGLTIGPIGENPSSAISQSQPGFSQVQLVAKKAGGLSLFSTEIGEDAVVDIADWLAEEFAYGFALFEDQCGFIGDGTSTYLGIRGLGNLFTTTGGSGGGQLVGAVDAASNHDTFAEIDYVDLQTVMSKLPEYARMNAKWFCSTVALDLVFGRILANAGGNTIQTMQGGYQRSYMGYPIVVSQVLPTSTGDLSDLPMLYFGDLRKSSTMGDRRDVRIFPSEHRYMDTDQIGVRGTERFDIVHHDVGDTTTGSAGPIVALVGD